MDDAAGNTGPDGLKNPAVGRLGREEPGQVGATVSLRLRSVTIRATLPEQRPAGSNGGVLRCGRLHRRQERVGNGLLEVSGAGGEERPAGFAIWVQVRDVAAQHRRLVDLGVPVRREPRTEPWGLIECWILDPDGTKIELWQAE